MTKTVLSFDLGASMGFAILRCDVPKRPYLIDSGLAEFKLDKKCPGKKWLEAGMFLDDMVGTIKPDLVVYEDVARHSSTLAGHSYGMFKYSLQAACWKHQVSFEAIGVSSWKKLVAYRGNADKMEVQAALISRFGPMEFETDDVSDAIGIGLAHFLTQ